MSSLLFVLNSAGGGAALSALELMGGLVRRGYTCFCVCPPSPEQHLLPLRNVATEVAEVDLPWWNKNYKGRWYKRPVHFALSMARTGFHVRSVSKLVRLIRRWGIDLVHSNTSLTLEGAVAAAAAEVPHIWHIREQIGADGLFRFWLPEPILARTFTSLADRLLANSLESKAFFERNGVGDRVDLVYNGIQLERFDDSDRGLELRRAWGVQDGGLVVGMVAHLTSRMKRHDVFLRAASWVAQRNPRVRFVVVGHDPEKTGGFRSEVAYARANKALARELAVQDKLVWAGEVNDVPSVMNALDLLVHPSDQESFGRVAVEAMAARKPVVAANSGGLREIVEGGVTGYRVRPNDPVAFGNAILRLADDGALRERLGRAGRARAEALFSLDTTVSAVERAYERTRVW